MFTEPVDNAIKKWNHVPDDEYPDDPNVVNDVTVDDAQSRKILLYNSDNGEYITQGFIIR